MRNFGDVRPAQTSPVVWSKSVASTPPQFGIEIELKFPLPSYFPLLLLVSNSGRILCCILSQKTALLVEGGSEMEVGQWVIIFGWMTQMTHFHHWGG